MAIYTRFGTRVNFASAQLFPVWIESRGSEVKWHYRKPTPTKKTKEITEMPIWFVTAVSIDDRDGHGPRGRYICDGKGICINEFRADEGATEIQRRCEELNVADSDKFNLWMHTDAGTASELFGLINEAMVA